MHYADEDVARLVVLLLQVIPRGIDQGRFAGMVTHREQSGRLFDGQTMIVFKQDP